MSVPSAKADQLSGIELSLRDILGRIPGLESLYRMTFHEEPQTQAMEMKKDGVFFDIRHDISRPIGGRDSLRKLVEHLRSRFPSLKMWRLEAAQQWSGNRSTIHFINARVPEARCGKRGRKAVSMEVVRKMEARRTKRLC